MANVTGRPVAPARKLVAAVLGTIAGFVMVFGLGMSSWAVVALGAALLALAVAIGVVNVARRGARAWIAGQGQVKAVSDPPTTAAYGRAELQLVVVAPGLPVTEVLVRDPRVPVVKWPLIDDTVPLTVDVDDMRRVRIDWDQAPDHGDDGDPPPPGGYEQPEEYLDDDLLGEPEPPPWATRDRQWGRGPDEPPPPPPSAATDPDALGSPVVVHDTPGGPVLEGQLVDHRPDRSEVLSDFPAAAAPGAAGDFAAAPPSSAYPSQAEESPYTRRPTGGADPAYIAEPTYLGDPPYAGDPPPSYVTEPAAEPPAEEPVYREPARTAEPPPPPASAARTEAPPAAATRPPGSRPRPRPHAPAQDGPRVAPDQAPEQQADGMPGSDDDAPPPAAASPAAPPSAARTTASPDAPDPEIDLPLDGDPEPAPEFSPEARASVASGIMAPPADSTTPPPGPPEDTTTTRPAEPSAASGTTTAGSSSPPTITGVDAAPTSTEATSADSSPDAPADTSPDNPASSSLDAPARSSSDASASSSPDNPESSSMGAGAGSTAATPAGSAERDQSAPSRIAAAAAAGVAAAGAAAAGVAHAITRNKAARSSQTSLDRDDAPPAPQTDPGHTPDNDLDQSHPDDAQPTAHPGAAPTDPPTAGTPTTAPPGSHAITPEDAAAMGRPQEPARTSAAAQESQGSPSSPAAHGSPTGPGRPWADLETGGYEPDERADDLITAYPSARPGPAGAIHGVGITVLVTDLGRSIAFYRDILGFFEIDHGPGSAVLASGDTRLVLRKVESMSSDIGRLVHLNLEVGDVEAVHDELTTKGVPFEHGPRPVNRGDKLELWAATFADPDGHTIAITQWRAVR